MAVVWMPAASRRRGRPRLPGALRWASRVQAWPPALWLALQAAALWPAGQWVARHLAGGPTQAPGLMALGALLLAMASGRLACHWPARAPWLLAAAALTVVATTMVDVQRPLPGLALSAGALLCAWAAFRRTDRWPAPAWPLRWPDWPDWRSWAAGLTAARPSAMRRAQRSLRPIEQAMRRLQRAAAWKCAYAAVLIACGLASAVQAWRG